MILKIGSDGKVTYMDGIVEERGNSLRDQALRAHIYQRDLAHIARRAGHTDLLGVQRDHVREMLLDRLGIQPEDTQDIPDSAEVEVDGLRFGTIRPWNGSAPFLCLLFDPCGRCGAAGIWAHVAGMADLGKALELGPGHYHACSSMPGHRECAERSTPPADRGD